MKLGNPLSVDEVDLLSFFEVEPDVSDADISWVYNNSVYTVGDGRCQVSFGVTPCSKDISIQLKFDNQVAYELGALSIEDLRYHNDKGRESLEVLISSRDSIWFGIKPQIWIRQNCSGPEE